MNHHAFKKSLRKIERKRAIRQIKIMGIKKSETIYGASEQRFRNLLMNTQQIGITINTQAKITFANSHFLQLTGWKENEIIGQDWFNMFLPLPERKKSRKIFQSNVSQTDFIEFSSLENNILTKTGELKRLVWSILMVRDVHKDIITVIYLGIDFTKVKEIEEINWKNITAFEQERSLFLNGPVVVFKWHNKPGWPVEYVSSNVKDITGYSTKEWLSKKITYSNIIYEKDFNRVSDEVTQFSHSGVERFEHKPYRLIRKDGNLIWVLDCTTILKDECQKITHYLGYIVDITERQNTQQTLKESETKYRTLVSNIPGVSYRCACDENWTMEFISDEIETLTGFPASDFLHNQIRSYASIIHPADKKMVENTVTDKVIKNEPYTVSYRVIRSNGERRWVFEKGQGVFNNQDQIRYLDGVIVDITRLKQIESELKKSRKTLEKKVKERTLELEDLNAALKILLDKREKDKNEIAENIIANYESLISPFLEKLRDSLFNKEQLNLMNIVDFNLKEIFNPFSKKLSDPMVNLTPKEIQIAVMVKQGLSNKEMAHILNKSVRTITNHRDHIRKKFGLRGKKINLQSYLSTL